MYKIDSQKAEEFICHEEILDTLEYAQSKSQDKELIRSIIEKARLCKGLSHREAAVLLECNDPELVEEIYRLAREIKQKFYGNRIVMFAPLYLSNYCVNSCTYCPYHVKNKTIARKKLTQEDIRREVIALQDMGHKRLALEAGEDPIHNPIEYILESIKTIYKYQAQERSHPSGKRKYCCDHGRELPSPARGRYRYLHSVPGNVPQGELRKASPQRSEEQLCLPYGGHGPRHAGRNR